MPIPKDIQWKPTGTTLGGGGQGDVHLVTRKSDPEGPKYALKVLRNAGSPQALERFQREIEVVKQLDHPAVVSIFDHSKPTEEFQFYVMEYYEGATTLERTIFSKDNHLKGEVTDCLNLFEQIILALQAYENHNPTIVHRDINPKNILLLPDGSIRIIDFGICQIDDGRALTLVDENVGPSNYISPECEAGNDGLVGIQSDIYSAAKVLWSAITSEFAFARERPAFDNRSMRRMFPGKPETWHLMAIFEKTIRESPADRFQRSDDILTLIQELRFVIKGGFPPLEDIRGRCPSCGWKRVNIWRSGYAVFGQARPDIDKLICDYCGFAFVRDAAVWKKNLDLRNELR